MRGSLGWTGWDGTQQGMQDSFSYSPHCYLSFLCDYIAAAAVTVTTATTTTTTTTTTTNNNNNNATTIFLCKRRKPATKTM